MVKKITKYLKFVVCCALIVSLIAPSYAALSASDGSAFVTKAEFDAALADFNSRLTTFEAGINSKIDSQVTSYLDRNGIWNGKRQELANGAEKRPWFVSLRRDFGLVTQTQTLYFPNGSANYGVTHDYRSESVVSLVIPSYKEQNDMITVVAETSKAGLIVFDFFERIETTYDTFNYLGAVDTSRSWSYSLNEYAKACSASAPFTKFLYEFTDSDYNPTYIGASCGLTGYDWFKTYNGGTVCAGVTFYTRSKGASEWRQLASLSTHSAAVVPAYASTALQQSSGMSPGGVLYLELSTACYSAPIRSFVAKGDAIGLKINIGSAGRYFNGLCAIVLNTTAETTPGICWFLDVKDISIY